MAVGVAIFLSYAHEDQDLVHAVRGQFTLFGAAADCEQLARPADPARHRVEVLSRGGRG